MIYYALWLVMLNGKDFTCMKYKDRYKLFVTPGAAWEWAKQNGYEESYFGPNTEIGHLNTYVCGDKEIGIISIKVEVP